MIIHQIEQGSKEWHNLRASRFTATDAQAILANGAGLKTAAYKKTAYLFTADVPEGFISPAMEYGKEKEPFARACYAEYIGLPVTQVGFCEMDGEMGGYAGCSPDGLVGDEGLCEIKCKETHNHLRTVVTGKIDTEHELQMQFQMLVTGRKWCDYVCYNDKFPNPLFVKRVYKDPDVQAKLADGLAKGKELIDGIYKQYEEMYL